MLLHYAPKYVSVSNPVLSLRLLVSSLRIVCLVPSITELIADMGLAAHLVGRTGFCIHPAHVVKHIPKVGGTKAVNMAKIRALAPTHVVVNVDENEKSLAQALRQWVPHVVVTHPQTPADNIALIDQLLDAFLASNAIDTVALGLIVERATRLKEQISERLALLQAIQVQIRPHPPRQRVLYLIWQDPWMTVARDTYISRMLALIGWQTWPDLLGGDGIATPGASRYPVVQEDAPWLADVDRVLLSSEPYRFGAEHIAQVQNWLPHTKVQLVDGEMLSWYGSRAIKGLDYLAALSAEDSAALGGAAAAPTSPE
jgi:ABC-type Fe3+-hydroxamate transport system substrate-binding protein